MLELVTGLCVLRDAGQAAMHVPWASEVMPVARRLELATAFALAPTTGFVPDFLTPTPSSPIASFEEEFERIRASDVEQVRANVLELLDQRPRSRELAELLADPTAGLARLADTLEAFWHEAFAGHWPRVRALLDADIAHRAQRLTSGGPARLFADLHPSVTWTDGGLNFKIHWNEAVALAGRGLLLVPSAMQWHGRPASSTRPGNRRSSTQPAACRCSGRPATAPTARWRESSGARAHRCSKRSRHRARPPTPPPHSTSVPAAYRDTALHCATPGWSPPAAIATRCSTPARRSPTSS